MEIIARLANLPGALPGACAQGLIWGIMAIGVYLTYRILDVADLTVDGSFGTGGAVCVMCLLSGMLFGPVLGGLAAGFGSMLYDALFGGYDLINCLITFVSKFLMAAICAWIAFGGKEDGKGKHARLVVGSVIGALSYVALYMLKTYIFQRFVHGYPLDAVVVTMGSKLPASLINAVFAMIVAPILYAAIAPALRRRGLLEKLRK